MPDLPVAEPEWPASWNIRSAQLLTQTNSCLIWKAEIAGDHASPVIIKQLKSAGLDALRGGYFLQTRDGHGAIRLLGSQNTPALMLLEYAGEHHLKDHLQNASDDQCTRIAAQVIAKLHHQHKQADGTGLLPLRRHFASLFALTLPAQPLYAQAAALVSELLEQPHQPIPLHGDIHHENIMLSQRGWLAIDPHGLFGDPAFDCANLFYNPLDRDDLCLDMSRAQIMAQVFASVTGTSAQRILDYAFCYGCLSAAWFREDGQPVEETRTLKIAAALNQLRQTTAQ